MPACTCQPCAIDTLPSGLRLAFAAAVALVLTHGQRRSVTLSADEQPGLLRLLGRLTPDHVILVQSVLDSDEDLDLLEAAILQPDDGRVFATLIRAYDQDSPRFFNITFIRLKGRNEKLYDHAMSVLDWSFSDLRFFSIAALRKALKPLLDADWARLVRGADRVLKAHLLEAWGDGAVERLAACPPLSDPAEELDRQRQAFDRALQSVIIACDQGIISKPSFLTLPTRFWFSTVIPPDGDLPTKPEFRVCPFAKEGHGCALTDTWGRLFAEGGTGDVPSVPFADILLARDTLSGRLLRRLTPEARESAVLSILAVLDPRRRQADPALAELAKDLFRRREMDAEWRSNMSAAKKSIAEKNSERTSYFLPPDSGHEDALPEEVENVEEIAPTDRSLSDIRDEIEALVYPSGKPPPLTAEQEAEKQERAAAALVRDLNLRLAAAATALSVEARAALLSGVRRRDPWLFRSLRADCWGGFADLQALSDESLDGLALRCCDDFLAQALIDEADVLWFRLSSVIFYRLTGTISELIAENRADYVADNGLARSQLGDFTRELIYEGHIKGWTVTLRSRD